MLVSRAACLVLFRLKGGSKGLLQGGWLGVE